MTIATKEKPLWIKCRGGCGKKSDLGYQKRIAARLGFICNPTYQCADCYLKSTSKGKGGL